MEKTAQKRSVLNRLREMTNVSGIAAEKFFNPEFKRVMESLREKDDQIRSMVSGVPIGEADPGPDPIGIKALLKSAKSNINRREYMTAVAELGRFHKKLFDVIQLIKNLSLDVDKVHHEFLFKDLDDERKQQLLDLKQRFATQREFDLIKEANIMDFFMNIGTKRGRALAAWEKRYPKQVGKLKKDTAMLLSRSEALLSRVLTSLKEMASARSTRNVDQYVKAADKIVKDYQNYDKTFKDYYTANVKGFLEKVELVSPTEKVEDAKELGKQEIPVETPSVPALEVKTPPKFDAELNVPSSPESMAPTLSPAPVPALVVPDTTKTEPNPPPAGMETNPPTMPPIPPAPKVPDVTVGPEPESEFKSDRLAKEMGLIASHQKFLSSLEAMAAESPALISAHIRKYARSIQNVDLEASIKLFQLAKNIGE